MQFLTSAKALADKEIEDGRLYPTPGAPCLLCHQPLSVSAVELLENYWQFLKSDAQTKLEVAQQACVSRAERLEQIGLNYFSVDSNVRRVIQGELEIIIPAIEAQTEACAARRQAFVQALRSFEEVPPPPLVEIDVTDLEQLAQIRRTELQILTNSNDGQELQTAEASYRGLRHRQILGDKLSDVKRYLERKKWAATARQSIGTTRTITTKYNELFEERVTGRYVTLFAKNLERFKKNIHVTIETRGSKGETVRQLALKVGGSARPYSVFQVLSDGEKRAVAISDFLAEVTLDQNCCGIIFDDPVTSLDDRWKDCIAQCLVEQALVKQVVIFTHDLAFLYHVKAHAVDFGVEISTHWIKDEGGYPGFVYQNSSPVCEGDYKSAKIAEDLYAKATKQPPEEQQSTLQEAFGALRASYEAFVIFDVFNGVVQRFEERMSFGRLKDVHDLFEEITAFNEIRRKQRELKKKN